MSFYDNLTNNGVFFFWIIVFLVVFLIILAIVLFFKNRKLANLIEKEKAPVVKEKTVNIPIIEEKPLDIEEEVSLEIKEEPILEIQSEKEPVAQPVVEPVKPVIEKKTVEKENIDLSNTGVYQRNVLREISRKMPTSPIHIERRKLDDGSSTDKYRSNNEYLKDDYFSSPLETMEDHYAENDNMRFASEIASRMEEEIRPSNIELTDYEKKQEEEAIISYDELLQVKDKIYNLTEDEETDYFIDELKSFRQDL